MNWFALSLIQDVMFLTVAFLALHWRGKLINLRKAGTPEHGHDCAACHQPRGRYDRYQILAWRHTDCKYPATHPLPETLMSELEKGRI